MTPAEIAGWQDRHPIATQLLGPVGLFNAFHCRPFLGTILLLAVNILTCTVLRFHRQGGFRALRGPAAIERTGFHLLHLSLILLFAGGFWSAAAKLDGRIILTEGQTFTEAHDSYVQLAEGPLRTEHHAGFSVRLRDVDIEYEKQHPVAVTSRLDILNDGDEVATGVVQVNEPLTHQGLSFTQSETGFSPRLVIQDAKRGRRMFDSFIALKTFRTEAGREYRDFVPLPVPHQRIIVTLYPSFTRVNGQVHKAGDVPDKPLLLLELEEASGQVIERQHLEIGGRVRLGGYTLAFADLRRWSSFRVGHDPGYPLVWAALWLGLVSLLMRYLPDLRHWFPELARPMPALPMPAPNVRPACQSPLPVRA